MYRLAIALLAPISASAACLPTEVAHEVLSNIGERVVGEGLDAAGMLVQVWASDHGIYSITISTPEGVTCLINHGENWRSVPTGRAS